MRVRFRTPDYDNLLRAGYRDNWAGYVEAQYTDKVVEGHVEAWVRDEGILYAIVLVGKSILEVRYDELEVV